MNHSVVFIDPVSGKEVNMKGLNFDQLIEYAVSLREKGYEVKNFFK